MADELMLGVCAADAAAALQQQNKNNDKSETDGLCENYVGATVAPGSIVPGVEVRALCSCACAPTLSASELCTAW